MKQVIISSKDGQVMRYVVIILVIMLIGALILRVVAFIPREVAFIPGVVALMARGFKELLKLVWVFMSLVISLIVFSKVQDACSDDCSPAVLFVALIPFFGISLHIWYQLFGRKSD